MAHVIQRQEVLFQSCDGGEFIYDKYVESECIHIEVKKWYSNVGRITAALINHCYWWESLGVEISL